MAVAEVQVEIEADAVKLRCDLCGESGIATGVCTGENVTAPVAEFARGHMQPQLVSVHFRTKITQSPLGWMEP